MNKNNKEQDSDKKVVGLFGVPLFEKNFVFKEKDKLIKYAKNLSGRRFSNIGGFQSKDFAKSNEPVYADFISQVQKDVGEAVGMFLPGKFQVICRGCWINVNGKNNWNGEHIHPSSDFTSTVYLKVPENSGNLYIKNPDTMKENSNFYNSPILGWDGLFARLKYTHYPKEDSIVIFPAYLPHSVGANETNKERISISMNFVIEKIWEEEK